MQNSTWIILTIISLLGFFGCRELPEDASNQKTVIGKEDGLYKATTILPFQNVTNEIVFTRIECAHKDRRTVSADFRKILREAIERPLQLPQRSNEFSVPHLNLQSQCLLSPQVQRFAQMWDFIRKITSERTERGTDDYYKSQALFLMLRGPYIEGGYSKTPLLMPLSTAKFLDHQALINRMIAMDAHYNPCAATDNRARRHFECVALEDLKVYTTKDYKVFRRFLGFTIPSQPIVVQQGFGLAEEAEIHSAYEPHGPIAMWTDNSMQASFQGESKPAIFKDSNGYYHPGYYYPDRTDGKKVFYQNPRLWRGGGDMFFYSGYSSVKALEDDIGIPYDYDFVY